MVRKIATGRLRPIQFYPTPQKIQRREWESRGAGEMEKRGRCRCEALRSPAEQSEAIPYGMASTIIPANDNYHVPNLGSVLLEAMR